MYVKIQDKPELFWKKCEVEECTNCVCIGVSIKYCFPHSGKKRKYLKYPLRNPVLIFEQERLM